MYTPSLYCVLHNFELHFETNGGKWLEPTKTTGQVNKQQRLTEEKKKTKSSIIDCDIIAN